MLVAEPQTRVKLQKWGIQGAATLLPEVKARGVAHKHLMKLHDQIIDHPARWRVAQNGHQHRNVEDHLSKLSNLSNKVEKGARKCPACSAHLDLARGYIKEARKDDNTEMAENALSHLHEVIRHTSVQHQGQSMDAGGPGSGCHGDNCGRPAGPGKITAHKILLQHGWRKIGKQEKTAWGKQHGQFNRFNQPMTTKKAPASIYKHWKHGLLIVNHSGGFIHLEKGGNEIYRQSVGKAAGRGSFAEEIKKYLDKIENAPVKIVQAPEAKPVEVPKGQVELKGTPQEVEQTLTSAGIAGEKRLGGGVNQTKVITLDNGAKAVFKVSHAGDDKSELAAWEIAKMVGMTDLVSPCVQRKIGGDEGCLFAWKEGHTAFADKNPWDSKQDTARAAAFDFVIGNEDRHMNNWLLDDDNHLHLIDHGLSFKDARQAYIDDRGFWGAVRGRAQNYREYPKPNELADAYVKAAPRIEDMMRSKDFGERAISGVQRRIDLLAKAKTWNELPDPA